MSKSRLLAISPVDGRYGNKTEILNQYFSEFALFRYRVLVEIEYFIFLAERSIGVEKKLNDEQKNALRSLYQNFSVADAQAVKEIESKTNHDVKAVEYFIKDKLGPIGLEGWSEFVHFGLTSQDINNTAFPKMVKDAHSEVVYPAIENLKDLIIKLGSDWNSIPMLSRTHGQSASPTTVGKELFVFVERLAMQMKLLKQVPFTAKFGGATGNFNAHMAAYPEVDWETFADEFVESLSLQRQHYTTQIEHYDNLSALLDAYKRINTILIDLCQDIWLYISMDYFKQEIKKGEVGSSTMPHKVNPIDFENAEGNLGFANSILEFLSRKLPVSRLQRDLTDSTVTRNLGVPLAHSMIAYQSITKGLNKLQINTAKIEKDLDENWAVVGEAIQTILRREGFQNPYEMLKELTRSHSKITNETILDFIENLSVTDDVKKELKKITPFNYIGTAAK